MKQLDTAFQVIPGPPRYRATQYLKRRDLVACQVLRPEQCFVPNRTMIPQAENRLNYARKR